MACAGGCSGHGRCGVRGHCLCTKGWYGAECNSLTPPKGQPPPVVVHRDTPSSGPACKCKYGWCGDVTHNCICLPGWEGELCDILVPTSPLLDEARRSDGSSEGKCTTADDCNRNGICQGGVCYCRPGFIGKGCEKAYTLATPGSPESFVHDSPGSSTALSVVACVTAVTLSLLSLYP